MESLTNVETYPQSNICDLMVENDIEDVNWVCEDEEIFDEVVNYMYIFL